MTATPTPRRWRTSALTVAVALVTAPAIALGVAAPAYALSSAQSLAGPNAWIMADLTAQGYGSLVESRTEPGTLDRTLDGRATSTDARRAPTTVGRSAGWLRKVPSVGRLGAILDVGAVILDLGGFSFGGDSWRVGDGAPGGEVEPSGATWSGTIVSGDATGQATLSSGQGGVAVQIDWSETPTRQAGPVLQARCSTGTVTSSVGWNGGNGWAGDRRTGGVQVYDNNCSPQAARIGTGTGSWSPWVSWGRPDGDGWSPTPPPAAPAPAPSTLRTRVECRAADGTELTVQQDATGTVAPGETITPADARCPDGMVAVRGRVDSIAPDGTATELVAPTDAPAWVGTIPRDAPGCVVAGAACSLDLETLTRADPETWTSCGLVPTRCLDWATQPGSRSFRCTFGGSPVGLDRCAGIEVDPNREGSPLKVEYPHPRPADAPAITPTRPSTDVQPEPQVPADAECRSTLVIFGGVLCALQEAFVPQRSLQAITAPLLSALSVRAPASWYVGIRDAVSAPVGAPGGGSCPDWRVQVGDHISEDITCDSAFNQLLHHSRPIMLGLMVIAAFAPLMRSLFYAAIPFLRVIPVR